MLRYYHVIGPRQDGSEAGGVVPIFVRRCLEGRPLTIYGTGRQTRSFTSVDDVVRVNLLVGESGAARREYFNCGCDFDPSCACNGNPTNVRCRITRRAGAADPRRRRRHRRR